MLKVMDAMYGLWGGPVGCAIHQQCTPFRQIRPPPYIGICLVMAFWHVSMCYMYAAACEAMMRYPAYGLIGSDHIGLSKVEHNYQDRSERSWQSMGLCVRMFASLASKEISIISRLLMTSAV